MERNIVAAGGKINVLRVWLPDNLHAESILIEALGPRYVPNFEGNMAHPFQPSYTAHASQYITPRRKCGAVAQPLAWHPEKRDSLRMKEALWWQTEDDGKILCTLCPRFCRLGEGQAGFCYIRKNVDGKLYSLGYGTSTGVAIDPIEKKPLNHFLPGTGVLSFGTAGCNLGCRFCQNWSISKARLDQHDSEIATPDDVVRLGRRTGSAGIAYTYNDPVIWAEFVIDVARAAHRAGLANVLVTAGDVPRGGQRGALQA